MTDLKILKVEDLQKICKISNIRYEGPIERSDKQHLVKLIRDRFKKLDDQTITKIKKLGAEGKDGIVWLIKYKATPKSKERQYALKQFKTSKSSGEILREAELQRLSAGAGLSPRIIDVDILSKFIIMEYIEGETLFDNLKKSNGVMPIADQRIFVKLIDRLDDIGVYHGDPSPLNFMYDVNKNLKVIDFGLGKQTNKRINRTSMLPGFILKMKQIGVDVDNNYTYIKKYIDIKLLQQCNISQ